MSREIQEVKDGLLLLETRQQEALALANATTGKTDTDLTSAVGSLVEGFGQGGDDWYTISGHWTTQFESLFEVLTDVVKLPRMNFQKATSLRYMCWHSSIEEIDYYIDCPNCTDLYKIFFGTATNRNPIKHIVGINTSNATSVYEMFKYSDIETIEKPLDFSKVAPISDISGVFVGCLYLREVCFVPFSIPQTINLAHCAELTGASQQSIIDGLADLTGQTAQTLTVHKDVEARMSEEQKATITAKNWTLVSRQ